MNKKLFYLATLLFVIMFSSCERRNNDSLVGTIWTASKEGARWVSEVGDSTYYRLNFINDTEVVIHINDFSHGFFYSYSNPVVIIDVTDCTGTVNGNQIVFQENGEIDLENPFNISGLTFTKEQ